MLKNDSVIGPLSSYSTALLQKGVSSVKNGCLDPGASRAMMERRRGGRRAAKISPLLYNEVGLGKSFKPEIVILVLVGKGRGAIRM